MYLWELLQSFSRKFFCLPQKQKRVALFLTGLCIFALVSPQIAPASAQVTQATVQEILDGNQVFIQNRMASIYDVAAQQQQVRTGNSRTALLFNTGAVARLSANSVLKIGQCARLQRGTILINGAVNACSSGITTGVRGTTYLLEVDELGNQQVKVLEGEVIVRRNDTPLVDEDETDTTTINKPTSKPTDQSNTNSKPTVKPSTQILPSTGISPVSPKLKQFTAPPNAGNSNIPLDDPQKNRPLEPLNAQPTNDKPILKVEPKPQSPKQPDEVVLKSGEKVEVDNKGALGIIQQLSENEYVSLLRGNLFQGFTSQIPGIDKVRSVFDGLFPGVNFPISIPGIPIPNIPSFPRLPF